MLMSVHGCKNFLGGDAKKFESLGVTVNNPLDSLTTKVKVRYCPSQNSETISENLLLIALDFSGSNNAREQGCYNGTDEYQKRLYELIKFIKKQTVNPGKSNLHIALIPFGTHGSQECYNLFNNKTQSITEYSLTDAQDIKDEKHEIFDVLKRLIQDAKTEKPPGYSQFLPSSCTGWTNYLETMQSMSAIKNQFMLQMKQKYPANGDQQSMVFVNGMFISDGEPLVSGSGQADYQIFSNVYDFIYLHNDKSNSNIKNVFTFLNTAYYTAPFAPGSDYHPGCSIPSSSSRVAIRARCSRPKCALANGLSYTCGNKSPKVICPIEEAQKSCTVDSTQGKVILDESVGSRLCDMSDIGGGNFFDLQNNPDYNDFKMTTFYNSYISEKIILQNKYSTWEQDEHGVKYAKDSDGDGLSDALEIALSSDSLTLDPNNPDSDGDGIRDSIEFYLNPAVGVPSTMCFAGTSKVDTDFDGLNDCEEIVLNLNPKVSDENLNKIPDWIDWKNKIQVNTTNSTSDIDGDGVPNLQELYENLPVNIHNQYLPKNLSKQTESTIPDPEDPSCLITTIDKFRISDAKEPMTIQFWYYARQREGSLRHLVYGEFPLEPGENKIIYAKDYVKGVSYEGQ